MGSLTAVPRYGSVAIALHWLLAVLLVVAFGIAVTMVDIPGITPQKLKLFNWHKWLGVTIFGLAVLRLLWRLTHPAPPLPEAMPAWQHHLATWTHWLLYGLILVIPLTGYTYSLASGFPVVWLGVVPLPVVLGKDPELAAILKDAHYFLNMTLLVVVILHMGAALKHHFIDRDDVLARMLPLVRPRRK